MKHLKISWRTRPHGLTRIAKAVVGCAVAGSLAACGAPSLTAFDLSAPPAGTRASARIPGQVVVVEPAALQALESERIAVKDPSGSVSFLGGGQWADRLPRLLQARLIETFENASRTKTVSRPGDGVTADFQLNTQVRAFQFDAGRGEVVVELSEKLIAATSGKIVRARVFSARRPVASSEAGNVARALDQAMAGVLIDIVRWVGTGR